MADSAVEVAAGSAAVVADAARAASAVVTAAAMVAECRVQPHPQSGLRRWRREFRQSARHRSGRQQARGWRSKSRRHWRQRRRSASAGGLPGGARPGATPGSRPTAGQLNNFLDVPRPSTGAISGARPGGAANDFLRGNVATQLPANVAGNRPAQLPAGGIAGNRPAQLPAGGVNRPSQLPGGINAANRPGVGNGAIAGARGDFAGNRPQRVENRQQLQQNRQQRHDEIRDQVGHDHPWRDFWSDHPGWAAWRITRPYRWATWGASSAWCGSYGWSTATPYNYGENVYYQDDQVYYGDQPVATADQYTEQAAAIAASARISRRRIPTGCRWACSL